MARGTRLHTLLEAVLASSIEPVDVGGAAPLLARPGWPAFTPDDCTLVADAAAYVYSAAERRADILTEVPVALSDDVGGTADVVVWNREFAELLVMDFKTGFHVVADDAPQLRLYAAAALASGRFPGVERVGLKALQPAGNPRGMQAQPMFLSAAEVAEFGRRALERAAEAAAPGSPLRPGEEQCRWCPASATCPALAAEAREAERLDVREIEDLADALELAGRLETWCAAVRDRAYALAAGGKHVPGWKLIRRRANRVWIDEGATLERLEFLVDLDSVAPRRLVSPAQAEKLLGRAVDLSDAWRAPEGSLALVRENAGGAPVNPVELGAAAFDGAAPEEDATW